LCCRQMQMEKGLFFHAVYRIQQKLGRAFRETRPYPLFPLDEYFGATPRKPVASESGNVGRMPSGGDAQEKSGPVRPPVRRVA
jgi:hypothetical protein